MFVSKKKKFITTVPCLPVILLVVLMGFLPACGVSTETLSAEKGYTTVRRAEIISGQAIPAPTNPVILTVRGKITNTNVENTLQLDMETIEKIGLVSYRVFDKQAEGREVEFEGVLISELLAVAGVAEEATTLYTVALNDYAIEIPIGDVETYPVLLATAIDGERLSVERYGPIRVIYPYHNYDMDETIYDPRWIWQLTTIEVR